MKKIITFVLIITVISGAVFAQDLMTLKSVSPKDAKTMGMGGAFVAMSEGFQSLYGNPADFASDKGELTLATINPWAYVKPTQENINNMLSIVNGAEDVITPASKLITENGLGVGASAGLGWVGKGLGFGVYGDVDAYVAGKTVLGASGKINGQVAAVAGLGFPIKLGALVLKLGADVRPYVVVDGTIAATDLISIISGSSSSDGFDAKNLPVDVGTGFAADVGASFALGRFLTVGLAVRDISTNITLKETTIGNLVSSLTDASLADDASTEYSIQPNITLGLTVRPFPEGLAKIIDLTVIAEIQDPLAVYNSETDALDESKFWNLFHAGAEVDILGGFISARAGVNKGWYSIGAGIDLFIAEINAAIFTEELGARPGDYGRTGIAVDCSVRF